MHKKFLVSLGIFTSTIIPMAMVVSCGRKDGQKTILQDGYAPNHFKNLMNYIIDDVNTNGNADVIIKDKTWNITVDTNVFEVNNNLDKIVHKVTQNNEDKTFDEFIVALTSIQEISNASIKFHYLWFDDDKGLDGFGSVYSDKDASNSIKYKQFRNVEILYTYKQESE